MDFESTPSVEADCCDAEVYLLSMIRYDLDIDPSDPDPDTVYDDGRYVHDAPDPCIWKY